MFDRLKHRSLWIWVFVSTLSDLKLVFCYIDANKSKVPPTWAFTLLISRCAQAERCSTHMSILLHQSSTLLWWKECSTTGCRGAHIGSSFRSCCWSCSMGRRWASVRGGEWEGLMTAWSVLVLSGQVSMAVLRIYRLYTQQQSLCHNVLGMFRVTLCFIHLTCFLQLCWRGGGKMAASISKVAGQFNKSLSNWRARPTSLMVSLHSHASVHNHTGADELLMYIQETSVACMVVQTSHEVKPVTSPKRVLHFFM